MVTRTQELGFFLTEFKLFDAVHFVSGRQIVIN